MNKTTLMTAFVIIVCIATLFASYNIYKSRIESINTPNAITPDKANSKVKVKVENKAANEDNVPSETVSLTPKQITSLTANMSDAASAVVTSRLQAGEQIQLLVIGSSSIEQGNPGYGELLTTNLSEAYGDLIETTSFAFEGTTADLVDELNGDLIDWSKDFDIVLLEGMNLSNNGEVVVEDSIAHIDLINKQMKQNVTDSVLLVHPSQPLANAVFYPTEVESFKSYLTARGITYIDHWTNWPVGNVEEMKTYLTEDSVPTTEGASLWASALSTFFTGK